MEYPFISIKKHFQQSDFAEIHICIENININTIP